MTLKESRAGQLGCTTHFRTKQQFMDSLRTGITIPMYGDYLIDIIPSFKANWGKLHPSRDRCKKRRVRKKTKPSHDGEE